MAIEHLGPMDTLDIVCKMRENGYAQHRDFDFAYFPGHDVGDVGVPQRAVFTFYIDGLESWFVLKFCT